VVIAIAIGALAVAGMLLLVRWALAAVTDYERATAERMDELDQFAGRVAHDLRNPLQAIGMSLAIVRERASDDRTRAVVDRAQERVRRMSAFIHELLQFARSGAAPDAGAATSVREALRAVEQDLAPSARQRRVTVAVSAPEGALAAIRPAALRAIVGNLADNAVKHMPAAGGERRVDIVAEQRDREIRIRVSDTGQGIPRDALPHLFEPFYRATTKPGGFGIGLKTVKRLVDAHRGRIEVESEPGAGAVFTVVLPAAEGRVPAGEPHRAVAESA
jgi:signal transduction histidine kinase